VRTLHGTALLAIAVLAAACSREQNRSTVDDELKRDLALAASSATDLAASHRAAAFSPTEIAPAAKPTKAPTVKKSAGPRAVRSKAPTVKAAPDPITVAEAEMPELQTTPSSTEAGTSSDAAVDESIPAVPRPTAGAIPVSYPTGTGSNDGVREGSGAGSILGGILGAVIRGGSVGEDRCEIHDRNRRPPNTTNTGGVYRRPPEPPSGMGGRGTVYGGGRSMPVPRSRVR
jgi:hypothetical protein